MKRLLISLLLVGLAGCAAPPQTNDPVTAGTICEREVRVGSALPVTRCTTAEQREADRRAAEAAGNTVRPATAKMPGSGS
ncbi:hypothetical protein [Roseateles sp.]|uniref:hypothetical protein n=1 Tax=Roseateles sp. TaxID=1971397 RepID=UPI00326594CC